MVEYFEYDYAGDAFRLFGMPHIVALALFLVCCVALIAFGSRIPASRRSVFRLSLAAALLVNEVIYHAWGVTVGIWSLETYLPLHLCSMLVWIAAIMLLTRSFALYEFVYFLGIAGATQAVITPDAGPFGFPHYRFFQVIISHSLIVLSALYMTTVEGFRPTLRSAVRVFLGLNVYALLVGAVNATIGSNYLFLSAKPETASLMDVLPPWPWYLAVLEAIAVLSLALLYLPFRRTGRTALPAGLQLRR
jgi:hypothetical integral membrane protein (TIGR02206 family)